MSHRPSIIQPCAARDGEQKVEVQNGKWGMNLDNGNTKWKLEGWHLSATVYTYAFIVPYSRCNALNFSFFCTVRLWNCLPLEVHTSEHLLQFKHHISPFFSAPLSSYLFMFYGALYFGIIMQNYY